MPLSSDPPQLIPLRERLIVALDVPSAADARALVDQLGDAAVFYKAGLELCMSGEYFELLPWLHQRGKKVFADLKFFDVPETVARAVRALSQWPVEFCTVHGNDAVMQAAAAEKGAMKLLAVTVLTSLDQGDLADLGFFCEVEQLVLSRARRALALGCDGVISSGLEAKRLREEVASGLIIVTPGIRPLLNRPTDDQKRVVTASDAFANGADYVVVGRPIRDAADPRVAAESLQQEIASYFAAR